jgi:hypothetical protein
MNFLIADKVETALAALVMPVAGTVPVYTGKGSDEKAAPCIICSAEIGEDEDPKGTGNYWVTATVFIKQSGVTNEDGTNDGAASPKATTQTVAASVIGALMVDNLATQLTAATSDLTVFDGSVIFGAVTASQDESGLWIDSIQIRLYACGAALS